jgi:hypothetical protein
MAEACSSTRIGHTNASEAQVPTLDSRLRLLRVAVSAHSTTASGLNDRPPHLGRISLVTPPPVNSTHLSWLFNWYVSLHSIILSYSLAGTTSDRIGAAIGAATPEEGRTRASPGEIEEPTDGVQTFPSQEDLRVADS